MIKKFHAFFENNNITYWHGSGIELPVGTLLTGGDKYNKSEESFSHIEEYRPEDKLSHRESLFMCHDPSDINDAGGSDEFLLQVNPRGEVQKHDMGWLVNMPSGGNEEKIRIMAENFWSGEPYSGDSLWIYMTTEAEVMEIKGG